MISKYLRTIFALILPVFAAFLIRAFFAFDQTSRVSPQPSVDRTTYRRIGLLSDLDYQGSQPDTTVIILNWSRFSNILRISSLLCSKSLDGIVAELFIWNNSPNQISYDDFRDTGCSPKLKIYNSPENLFFQARFLACAQANTPYCFIQDDDYLVLPEVIHTLHAQLVQSNVSRTIHLLPPHEHLSTALREIQTTNHSGTGFPIHTSFAWLGHGAILHRREAIEFLDLMRILNASEAEMKMADNYYTILSNRVPEVWFDQGIELGGGQPFTVGTEGEERNNRHTLRAAEYLSSIASGGGNEGFALSALDQLPYVSCSSRDFDTSTTRAVCRSSRCLLETNIVLLPSGLKHVNDTPKNMLAIEASNRDAMGAAGAQFYINHAPLNAVDDRHETYFLSPNHARAGDFIMLDFCDDIHSMRPWRSVMMTWLVDLHTELALKTCVFETSLDGVTWASSGIELACKQVVRDGAEPQSDDAVNTGLRQCITVVDSSGSTRYFRVTLMENQGAPWSVHEISVLGRA